MQAKVLVDPAMSRLSGRAVLLYMDFERPGNAAFFATRELSDWISLVVIDPRSEIQLARRDSHVRVQDLELLIETAEQAMQGDATGLSAGLIAADGLYANKHYAQAASAYSELLSAAPDDWKHRERAPRALVDAYLWADQGDEAAHAALRLLPTLRGADAALLARHGLEISLDTPKTSPTRKAFIAAFEPHVQRFIESPPLDLPEIDLSQMHRELIRVREDAGDVAGAKAVAERWMMLLEASARRTQRPELREVLDVHRMIAVMTLEQPARALVAFETTDRELPWDYVAINRLSGLYRRLGRLDEALAASDRSLLLAYGANKSRVLLSRAEIQSDRGEQQQAIRTLEQAVANIKQQHPSQMPAWLLPQYEQRLKAARELQESASRSGKPPPTIPRL